MEHKAMVNMLTLEALPHFKAGADVELGCEIALALAWDRLAPYLSKDESNAIFQDLDVNFAAYVEALCARARGLT